MCGKDKIMLHCELARELQSTDPHQAAKHFLIAADELLRSPPKDKEQQARQMAQRLYQQAITLKSHCSSIKAGTNSTKLPNTITFDDIGGLDELKKDISFKIIEPFKNPELFKYYGKKAGGGILMYGPPGCGKTLIAKATAGQAQAEFIHVKASSLKSKYVGETEKNIDELFARSKEKPTIIFFDEFEAIGQDRTTAQPHEKNFVAQLLTEMDGMDSRSPHLLLLAATNEPWSIDPALRREGRFGTTIFIPPPDIVSRRSIFGLHLKNRPTVGVDLDVLAENTAGCSGADIKSICEKAVDAVMQESLFTNTRRSLNTEDLLRAVEATKSILPEWFIKARREVLSKGLKESFSELFDNRYLDQSPLALPVKSST